MFQLLVYVFVYIHPKCTNYILYTITFIYILQVVCKLDGAYLAEIEDQRENDFIKGLITGIFYLDFYFFHKHLSKAGRFKVA